jgi:hypothetical protein
MILYVSLSLYMYRERESTHQTAPWHGNPIPAAAALNQTHKSSFQVQLTKRHHMIDWYTLASLFSKLL